MTDAHAAGSLPCQSIEDLIAQGAITSQTPFDTDQVQPASFDLRLGARAWRVRASLPAGPGRTVPDRMKDVAMHELDLTQGAVLEKGCVYIAEIQERLALPGDVAARGNPKSSTGRVDVFVRLLTDHGEAFDDVEAGYDGPLYIEIAPQTFSVLVRVRHAAEPTAPQARRSAQAGDQERWRRPDAGRDRRSAAAATPASSTWTTRTATIRATSGSRWSPPRRAAARPGRVLHPGLQGRRPDPVLEAAEMTPIDPSVGEFRVHYAGFFDPGFGTEEAGAVGSKGVLEVRSHETPFLLEDGQTVARLVYEPLTARPDRLYGEGGSHYQRQGLKLSKHFKAWR